MRKISRRPRPSLGRSMKKISSKRLCATASGGKQGRCDSPVATTNHRGRLLLQARSRAPRRRAPETPESRHPLRPAPPRQAPSRSPSIQSTAGETLSATREFALRRFSLGRADQRGEEESDPTSSRKERATPSARPPALGGEALPASLARRGARSPFGAGQARTLRAGLARNAPIRPVSQPFSTSEARPTCEESPSSDRSRTPEGRSCGSPGAFSSSTSPDCRPLVEHAVRGANGPLAKAFSRFAQGQTLGRLG